MSREPIVIIGAGIAGLTLGRCLKKRGIPAIVYEQSSNLPRHNYSITLQSWAYNPLLQILGKTEKYLRHRTATKGPYESGKFGSNLTSEPRKSCLSFSSHRNKLQSFLSDEVSIRHEHRLERIILSRKSASLTFKNGEKVRASLVVGADGALSQMRKTFIKPNPPRMLPCVAFNGRRHLERDHFRAIYASYFGESTSLKRRIKAALLQISISGYTAAQKGTDISYTYSRLPFHDDPLFACFQSNALASGIPEAFFTEVEALQGLEEHFADAFDVSKLRKDKLLQWEMRSSMADKTDLRRLAEYGIVMIGDSVHAEPILGGQGANMAMKDGVDLADFIAEHGDNAPRCVADFYDSRYERWKTSVSKSEKALLEMHEGYDYTHEGHGYTVRPCGNIFRREVSRAHAYPTRIWD